MATGSQVLGEMLATFRIPGISYGFVNRCNPYIPPHEEDCSGATTISLQRAGIAKACDGSFAQSRAIHQHGVRLTIEQAFKTPGAFLFQGPNEGQGALDGSKDGVWDGHVGESVGDDQHTAEARGHWAGVGIFLARSLVWDFAGMYPGVTTGAAIPPPTLPPLAVQEDDMTMIALPATGGTPTGRVATARPVKAFNFVLLEDGGRLKGDVGIDAHRHWWAPPNLHQQIPGAQILDIADMRPLTGEKAIAVRYGYPNGDAGTYKAMM